MSNIVSSTTGAAFLIILFLRSDSIPAETISGCDVYIDMFKRLKADCSSKDISAIPSDLGSGIQMLDVSNNSKINQLHHDDLKNYAKLWGLNIGNLSLTEFPAGFFKFSPKIEMLNMSRTLIKSLKEIPNSITTLNYTYSLCEYIDVSHLTNLQKLFLRFSVSLKKIPTIYSLAPLRILDLRNCSLIEAEYSQVAIFCKLTYFGLESTHLAEDKYVKQCCGLRKWGRYWNITGVTNQNCSRLTYPACKNLNIQFDPESVKLYANCIYRDGFRKYTILMTITLICVIIILILIGTSTWYYYHHFDIPFWSDDRSRGKKSTINSLNSSEMEPEEEID